MNFQSQTSKISYKNKLVIKINYYNFYLNYLVEFKLINSKHFYLLLYQIGYFNIIRNFKIVRYCSATRDKYNFILFNAKKKILFLYYMSYLYILLIYFRQILKYSFCLFRTSTFYIIFCFTLTCLVNLNLILLFHFLIN